jgi:2,5-dihydroxypyridine 5,6-dioxygenase
MTALSALDPLVQRAARVLITDHLQVRAGENLLITTDPRTDADLATVLFNAAEAAGAKPLVARIPQLPLQGKLADRYLPTPLRSAMAESDCWIDLTFPYIAGSDAHDAALKAGRVRCLVAGGMDTIALAHLYAGAPLDAIYELQSAFDQLVAGAEGKSCRMTDTLGSAVEFTMGKPTGRKPRQATKPGVSYSLPGSVVMYPELESVHGRIVIVGAMHDWYGALERPLTLEVDGRIRRVLDSGPDVQLLDRALRRAGGGEYGHVIHFSYGLHPAARYRGNCFVEDIRVVGASAIGFGKPWWEPGGGENHPDGLVLRQNLWIDGLQVLENGLVIAPEPLAAVAQRALAAAAPA